MSDAPPKQPVTGTASVRMDTGAGLPPFPGANADTDPVPVTPASSGAGVGMSASAALVSMHNAASHAGGDAFPVLKAFQDYLESERQRARHRMMTLSIVFAVVIIVVVGAFILFWFSSMRGVQDTNRQLLEAALKRANAEPPAPVVVQTPQPSAAETAKVIAEAVSKAQAEQTVTFSKTLEGLNASLESLRQDNAEMRAEIEREKAAVAKAAAEKVAAERAAAAKAAAERAAAEKKARAAREAAQKVAAQKTAVTREGPALSGPQTGEGPASSGPQAVEGLASSGPQAGEGPASSGPQAGEGLASSGPQAGEGPASSGPQAAAKPLPPPPPTPAELQIPKYDSPPPPEGFSQDVMAVRLQKEPRPISWRVYVPMRAE